MIKNNFIENRHTCHRNLNFCGEHTAKRDKCVNKLNYTEKKYEKNACDSASVFFRNKNNSKKVAFKGVSPEKLAELTRFEKFLKSKMFINACKYAYDAPGITETLSAVAIVCTLRPATILLTPGAEKRDKQYAAAKSIASGLIDLAVTLALLNPVKNAYSHFEDKILKPALKDNEGENFEKLKHLKELNVNGVKDNIAQTTSKFFVNFTPKFLTVPVRAGITIALIPVIMKYFFPNKNDDKQNKEKPKVDNQKEKMNLKTIKPNLFNKFGNRGA